MKMYFFGLFPVNVHTLYLVRFGHGGAQWAMQPTANARERHDAEQLELGLFSYPIGRVFIIQSSQPMCIHRTWLGSAMTASVGPEPAAPSGRNRQAECRESQGAAACRDYASSPGRREAMAERPGEVDAASDREMIQGCFPQNVLQATFIKRCAFGF